MGVRLKTGDLVKIISGHHKGTSGKITKFDPKNDLVFIENFGKRERHIRANAYRQAGKKSIQVGIPASKVKLIVDEKSGKTSRVGFIKDASGKTVRVARQANNKEIK